MLKFPQKLNFYGLLWFLSLLFTRTNPNLWYFMVFWTKKACFMAFMVPYGFMGGAGHPDSIWEIYLGA